MFCNILLHTDGKPLFHISKLYPYSKDIFLENSGARTSIQSLYSSYHIYLVVFKLLYWERTMPKKKEIDESDDNLNIPPVIPLTQMETTDDGRVVTKRVKPLTYSLMSWVKTVLNLPDTIEISDDENLSRWTLNVPSEDESFEYGCFFNVDETKGLIRLYIYYINQLVEDKLTSEVEKFILDKNMLCETGHFELVKTENGKILRYVSGVSVRGIASEDPDYQGEFQISPKLYDNMFEDGLGFMNSFIEEFQELLNS